MPLSPTSRARLPAGLNAIDLIAFVPVNPFVLSGATSVPLNVRTTPLRPPINAYWPLGFQATVFKSLAVPVEKELIVVPSYVLSNTTLQASTTDDALGCKLS